MAEVAPPELGKLLRDVFYKHYAPPALQNLGIRRQYQISSRVMALRLKKCPDAG